MFCVVSHGVSDRGRCQSRDLCSLVPTRTGAGCGGCGREEEAKIFFVKVCFSKAKILIAFRCGGWGRQEEAKIFVAFHFIYRGGSAAGGDRQADRRISTYTHTHTRARAPTRHTHVTKHIRRCCGHTKMRSVDLVNNSLLGSRPLWLSDSITDSGCGRSQPPFRGGGVGGNG